MVDNLVDKLSYNPVELQFGTSGLRGLVIDMTDLECYVNARGFLSFIDSCDESIKEKRVLIAGDLRDSTPRIMTAVAKAITDQGFDYDNAGLVPTPAAAFGGISRNIPTIVVTGSHIPSDRNGIKFYKSDGEVLKNDEVKIHQHVESVRKEIYTSNEYLGLFDEHGMLISPPVIKSVNNQFIRSFIDRYTSLFSSNSFKNKKVIVYQHSAVGRDHLVELLGLLGAEVVPVLRSEKFIPIDTENITEKDHILFKKIAKQYPDCFAIVSTDGDSDRPFVIDEAGRFYNGDLLGCLVAEYLGATSIAIPISRNDAVDTFCQTKNINVKHTKIGSPYVIDAMQAMNSNEVVCGWEANGGFLTGCDIKLGTGTLAKLATRDAFLPIIISIISATVKEVNLSELFSSLPKRYISSGLVNIDDYTLIISFIERVARGYFTKKVSSRLMDVPEGSISSMETIDGLRLVVDENVIHIRPSGNAPQVRIYATCNSQEEANDIVKLALSERGTIYNFLHA